MTATISDKAKQPAEQYVQIQQASKQLEEVLGESAGVVEAQWDRAEDEKGRPLYLLRLKDSYGEVTGRFAPTEFQSSDQIYFRLYRLWGDLLGVQVKRRLQELGD